MVIGVLTSNLGIIVHEVKPGDFFQFFHPIKRDNLDIFDQTSFARLNRISYDWNLMLILLFIIVGPDVQLLILCTEKSLCLHNGETFLNTYIWMLECVKAH